MPREPVVVGSRADARPAFRRYQDAVPASTDDLSDHLLGAAAQDREILGAVLERERAGAASAPERESARQVRVPQRRAPAVLRREPRGGANLEGDLLSREQIDRQVDGAFRPRAAGREDPVPSAHELRHHCTERTLVRNFSFDAFRNELRDVGIFLEVAVLRSLLHRPDRSHSAIGLERAALIQNRLAGRFVSSREE